MMLVRVCGLALSLGVALVAAAQAVVVNVPVSSSDTAAWPNSGGGTGPSVPIGGPSVWNATFTASIPAGSTSITFTLDSFSADDKGVVQLNGTTIADHVIFRANGAAAGAGTFDFGQGAGNQAYTFVGWTPGTAFPLPDGTTTATIVVFVNDTSTSDPNAAPLPVAFTTSFSLSGTLSFDAPATATPTASATATATPTGTATTTPVATLSSTPTSTASVTATATATATRTPTRTATPTLTGGEGDVGPPAIPTLSGAGVALLALLVAGMALLALARSRG